MRILLTKLRHIGDNLLITPTIVAIKNKIPEAEIWVVVRDGTEGILAGCPEITKIITTAKPEQNRRSWNDSIINICSIYSIISHSFDIVFELGCNDRGRIFMECSMAKIKAGLVTNDNMHVFWKKRFTHLFSEEINHLHQVERDYLVPKKILKLPDEPPPLRFSSDAILPVPEKFPSANFAILQAATRWNSKKWSLENWLQVINQLLEFTPWIIISSGADKNEVLDAKFLCKNFHPYVIATEGKLCWQQMAFLASKASYYVGVDTATMHLAAAMSLPCVTLFGQTVPHHFSPWKNKTIMLAPAGRKTNEPAEDIGLCENHRMLHITINDVVKACYEIMKI